MKKILMLSCFLFTTAGMSAQHSTFKAGIHYNADYVDHKAGKISYPSLEAAWELSICKKFSFNFGYNYAVRKYTIHNDLFPMNNFGYINYDHSLLIEGRYYLKSNSEGLFFQAGIPIIYTTEKPLNSQISYKETYWAMNAYGGIGLKYNLAKKFAIEMNVTISPSFDLFDLDYGTAGFIKSGIKLCYSPAGHK